MDIRQINDKTEKACITLDIMHSLPKWFSPKEDIDRKAIIHQEFPFFACYYNSEVLGFLALKVHNEYTAEIYTIAVKEEYHHNGIGSALLVAAEAYCKDMSFSYLTVKTLDKSASYEPYEKTRAFYKQMGFTPLEIFPTLWDKDNPCIFLVKHLYYNN